MQPHFTKPGWHFCSCSLRRQSQPPSLHNDSLWLILRWDAHTKLSINFFFFLTLQYCLIDCFFMLLSVSLSGLSCCAGLYIKVCKLGDSVCTQSHFCDLNISTAFMRHTHAMEDRHTKHTLPLLLTPYLFITPYFSIGWFDVRRYKWLLSAHTLKERCAGSLKCDSLSLIHFWMGNTLFQLPDYR